MDEVILKNSVLKVTLKQYLIANYQISASSQRLMLRNLRTRKEELLVDKGTPIKDVGIKTYLDANGICRCDGII